MTAEAERRLDAFLSEFDEAEQERILRYALDHIVPKLSKGTQNVNTPTEAERLAKSLRIKAGCVTMGEKTAWGSDAALMVQAALFVEQQATELKRLHDYDNRLTAVMPADFKDWHENSRNEWPEIAAGSIKMWRDRALEAYTEIERLKDVEFELRLALTRHLQSKDALLRQALEALEKTRAFHQQDWSSEEITPKLTRDTIAAIKQHLGEV